MQLNPPDVDGSTANTEKKNHLNFTNGMMVAKKKMKKRLNKHIRGDLLSQLLTEGHQMTIDTLLIMFDDELELRRWVRW